MPNDEDRTIRTLPDGTTTETVRVLTDEEQAHVADRKLLEAFEQIVDPTTASAAQTVRAFQAFLRRFT